jgi:hypothetical protein
MNKNKKKKKKYYDEISIKYNPNAMIINKTPEVIIRPSFVRISNKL